MLACYVIFTGEECQLLSSVMTLKSEISEYIEPDFGLLDELLGRKVLTRRQIADVRSERTVYRRTDALLDILTTQDQCDKFIKALKKTGQQHVVNYITHNGGLNHSVLLCDDSAVVVCVHLCMWLAHSSICNIH